MRYFFEEPVYPYPSEVPEIEYELPVDDQPSPEYTQQPPEDQITGITAKTQKAITRTSQNAPVDG